MPPGQYWEQRWHSDDVQLPEATGGKSKEAGKITSNNRSSNQNGITCPCYQCDMSACVLSCQLLGTNRFYTHISGQTRHTSSSEQACVASGDRERRLNSVNLKLSEENPSPTWGQPLASVSKPLTFVTSQPWFLSLLDHTHLGHLHMPPPRIPCTQISANWPHYPSAVTPRGPSFPSHFGSLPWLVFFSYTPPKIILFFHVIY